MKRNSSRGHGRAAALAAVALTWGLMATSARATQAPLYGWVDPAAKAQVYIVLLAGVPQPGDIKVPAARSGDLSQVAVDPDVADLIDTLSASGATVTQAYGELLKGFAAELTSVQLAKLRQDPRVESVWTDEPWQYAATQTNPPTWGLDRIDQTNLPLDQSYTYPNSAGTVHYFVLDSGIRATHNDLKNAAGTASRVTSVWDVADNDADTTPCANHGTNIAGLAGGRLYGVAKDLRLYAVKVSSSTPTCGGPTEAGLLAGIDRTMTYVNANNARPAVVNASWAASTGRAVVEVPLLRMVAQGVHVMAAAGNVGLDGADAKNYGPARLGLAASIVTVGASTASDSRALGTNYGIVLNLLAPGNQLTTIDIGSDSATTTTGGTSMATPVVGGVAALCLQNSPSLSPADLKRRLVNCSTPGALSAPSLLAGTPNRLLNVNACGCTAGPTYSDMASSYWAYPAVSCLDKYGIGFPCEATKYCGTTALKRWEMAVYIVEAKQDEANLPTYKNYFTDVPADEWWTTYVERFKELNITAGCGPGLFCPNNSVTRADMAVFIIKAIGQTPLTTYKGYFTDVPAGQYYTGYVEKAKELGIIAGCTSTTYCPTQNVTREQTASIVRNAFSSSLTCP